VRVEGEDEGEGETKCKGTKQMGQNEWDEVNVGRNDRVPRKISPIYFGVLRIEKY
jgi:hypothetical protein